MPDFGDWLARHWRRAGSQAGAPTGPFPRPDVVHAHFWMSGLAALRARTSTGVPVVQTFHALGVVKRRHQGGKDTSPADRLSREAAIAAEADAVVATCSDEVAELLALGASADRLHVAPCGVDLRAFTPDGPVAPREPGRRRILSIGRLVERKGVDTLVDALAHLPERLPDGSGVELVVAGGPDVADLDDDPEVRRLRGRARAAGVEDRVRFVGRAARDDVPALLRSADVVACVPWYEPFGIVPLEAMACGVPVVAAGVGGMLDSVVDGATGVHVPPRDPRAAAAALAGLLSDEARRARMGRAGAAHVADRFGWPRVAELTEAVYLGLLDAAGPGVPREDALRAPAAAGPINLTGGARERALA
jgi:glycosyltransferase involved in cell wall biosynthesis